VPWMVTTAPTLAHPPPVPMHTAVWSLEVSARKSAVPGLVTDSGKVEVFTVRKRRRVTLLPVLFVNRRRIESVPLAPLVTGVGSR